MNEKTQNKLSNALVGYPEQLEMARTEYDQQLNNDAGALFKYTRLAARYIVFDELRHCETHKDALVNFIIDNSYTHRIYEEDEIPGFSLQAIINHAYKKTARSIVHPFAQSHCHHLHEALGRIKTALYFKQNQSHLSEHEKYTGIIEQYEENYREVFNQLGKSAK